MLLIMVFLYQFAHVFAAGAVPALPGLRIHEGLERVWQ